MINNVHKIPIPLPLQEWPVDEKHSMDCCRQVNTYRLGKAMLMLLGEG